MKYTDRKKTPLKWHRFLEYFCLPVSMIMAVYQLLSLVNELFGLQIPHLTAVLKPVLAAFGATISNLGSTFWYVVAYFGVRICMTILIVYVCFGFFSWKENARRGWLYYLLVITIETALIAYESFMLYLKSPSVLTELLGNYAKANGMSADIVQRGSILLSVEIFVLVINALMLILNAVYYGKRKALFTETYVQPLDAGMVITQPEAPVPAVNEPVSVEPVMAPSDAEAPAEITAEPEGPAVQDVPAAAEETAAPQPAAEEKPVEAAAEIPAEKKEKILKFCPNCGAELGEHDKMFCTHCGTKLK